MGIQLKDEASAFFHLLLGAYLGVGWIPIRNGLTKSQIEHQQHLLAKVFLLRGYTATLIAWDVRNDQAMRYPHILIQPPWGILRRGSCHIL